ncbi:hypothetical protein EIP91_001333 [Steccherinum ochraceum]|uniref:Uncharacterized protein n=1 Tax=Steccherinum ochraceum TaxID=92696 RepID=A0A4R0RI32_9APHY|nr:hypothetical protein EIP91_001333 [Steccherinum ochraceum]
MPSLESPLNAAHQHAANADEFMNQGLLIPASEEHYKAAEAFAACIIASSEENTKRTLRMLYNEHAKAGKELQRKIAKLREEGKDPSKPQKSLKPTSNNATSGPSVAPPPPASSPPPTPRNNLSDSQQTVEESFMLLGHRSEGSDAFNTFWRITEGMLHHLSQPVAFATAPLGPENGPSSARKEGSGSDTDLEDPISRKFSRSVGLISSAKTKLLSRNNSASDSDGGIAGISTFPPKPQASTLEDDWDEDELDAEYDNMADSFCLIPSKSEPSASTLKKENSVLKVELEEAQRQLASANKALKQRQEQDLQLRDSIMLARKEAQRAMSSSMAVRPGSGPVDLTTLNITAPPVPSPVPPLTPAMPRDREGQLVKKIRDLEDEIRAVRVENEKQKAMIVKFRERWDKVKESHKRKKQAQAAAEAPPMANGRIQEEPEAEAQAEKEDMTRHTQAVADVVTAAA